MTTDDLNTAVSLYNQLKRLDNLDALIERFNFMYNDIDLTEEVAAFKVALTAKSASLRTDLETQVTNIGAA